MARFSDDSKYRFFRLVLIFGLFTTIVSLSRMAPYASPHHNKVWFAITMVCVVAGVSARIASLVYRSNVQNGNADTVPVETLAHLGQELEQQKINTKPNQPKP